MKRGRLLALAFTLLCLSFGAPGCKPVIPADPGGPAVNVAAAKDAAVGGSITSVDSAVGIPVDMSSSPKPFGLQYNGSIRIVR